AGEVTVANGGDVAKALGVLPAGAATPTAAADLIAGPFGDTLTLTPAQEQTVRAAAAAVRPSLVEIVVRDSQSNLYYSGSGMVVDTNGDILTDAHVVAASSFSQVLLPSGQVVTGQVVGRDYLADVAVVHVATGGLTPVSFGSSA